MASIKFSDVEQAQAILKGLAHDTPVLNSRFLNSMSGATVYLKCENFQRTGAFKFRGAYHAVARLDPQQRSRPVMTLSSGNHAQGVALACQLQGLEAHIVMPEPMNPLKLAAVQGYGGIVHHVATPLEGEQRAEELMAQMNGRFIHAFNDPHVIAGQGTATLEFLETQPDLDILLAPVGGGGLLSGTCLAAHGNQSVNQGLCL